QPPAVLEPGTNWWSSLPGLEFMTAASYSARASPVRPEYRAARAGSTAASMAMTGLGPHVFPHAWGTLPAGLGASIPPICGEPIGYRPPAKLTGLGFAASNPVRSCRGTGAPSRAVSAGRECAISGFGAAAGEFERISMVVSPCRTDTACLIHDAYKPSAHI